MTEIASFLGMRIHFCEDYKVGPHVHIHYHPMNASISVFPPQLLSGNLPPRVVALAVEWILLNQEALKRNWEILQRNGTGAALPPIAPLVSVPQQQDDHYGHSH